MSNMKSLKVAVSSKHEDTIPDYTLIDTEHESNILIELTKISGYTPFTEYAAAFIRKASLLFAIHSALIEYTGTECQITVRIMRHGIFYNHSHARVLYGIKKIDPKIIVDSVCMAIAKEMLEFRNK